MDQILLALRKRFIIPLVIVGSILAWFILCHAHYKSYWYGTIYRVQTVDFNMLHHTLPPLLSRMIIEGRSDLVQKTLDSTYGLFGLVVTDASGSTILWQTNKVYHRESWHHKVNPQYLGSIDEPFDLLTASASLSPTYEHASPRSPRAEKIGVEKDEVIGRIYYVRADPPAFLTDLGNFATSGPWVLSGAKRGYLFVTLSCIAFGMVILLVIWLRKRGVELKEKEVEHVKRELEIRKKALDHLTSELEAQKSRKHMLEKEADQAYKRAVGLKRAIESLRDQLNGVPGGTQQNQAGNPGGNGGQLVVRPPTQPQSSILLEIEELLPSLNQNAQVLKDQAGILHEYCSNLEQRQVEMQRIVDNAYQQSENIRQNRNPQQYIDMSPK